MSSPTSENSGKSNESNANPKRPKVYALIAGLSALGMWTMRNTWIWLFNETLNYLCK